MTGHYDLSELIVTLAILGTIAGFFVWESWHGRKPPGRITVPSQRGVWAEGGDVDEGLAATREPRSHREPRLLPLRVRSQHAGTCRGIPCVWLEGGWWSPCLAHDPRRTCHDDAVIADMERRLAQ